MKNQSIVNYEEYYSLQNDINENKKKIGETIVLIAKHTDCPNYSMRILLSEISLITKLDELIRETIQKSYTFDQMTALIHEEFNNNDKYQVETSG